MRVFAPQRNRNDCRFLLCVTDADSGEAASSACAPHRLVSCLNCAFICAESSYRTGHLVLAGGDLTRMQDWRQLAFKEINEPMLIRPDLDQNEVVKASLDRAIDGREMRLW